MTYHGLDVSVNAMNDALYAQGFAMPAGQEVCLVTLNCPACTLADARGLYFHAYPKGHGNQKYLSKDQKNKSDRTMRVIQKHYRNHHPEQARHRSRKRTLPAAHAEETLDRELPAPLVELANEDGVHAAVAPKQNVGPGADPPAAKRARIEIVEETQEAHVQPAPHEGRANDMQLALVAPAHVPLQRQPQQQQQQHLYPVNHVVGQQVAVRGNAAGVVACKPGMVIPHAIGATQMVMQRPEVAPGLVNRQGQEVQLPCMIQMEFLDPVLDYGQHQVWALLLLVDHCERTLEDPRKLSQRIDTGEQMRNRFVGNKGMSIAERTLYIHRIEHVTPMGSPLAKHVGQHFSSLFASAQQLGGKKLGLDAWHLVHQPHIKLANIIAEQGFCHASWMQSLMGMAVRNIDILSRTLDNDERPLLQVSMVVTKEEMAQPMEALHSK